MAQSANYAARPRVTRIGSSPEARAPSRVTGSRRELARAGVPGCVYGLGAMRSQNAQLCCAESCATLTTSLSPAGWRDISCGLAKSNRGQAGAPVAVDGFPLRANAVTYAISWS